MRFEPPYIGDSLFIRAYTLYLAVVFSTGQNLYPYIGSGPQGLGKSRFLKEASPTPLVQHNPRKSL
jgi:hypothetical protein